MKRVRDESGSSLGELMVVLALLSIVLGTVFGGFNAALRASSEAETRLENLDEARPIMANLTKDLRTATRLVAGTSPFMLADAREATFYANLNTTNGPKRVRLYVDAQGQMVQDVTDPDPDTGPSWTHTGTPKTRILGKYVANGPGLPIFTYYDDAGATLPTPLSATDLLRVDGVGVKLAIRKTSSLSAPATTIENRVRLPNLDYDPTAT